MTVCIAALCSANNTSRRVVVAADRMVTYPGYIEFEHPGSKMVRLSDRALVMVAGDTLLGMRLANDAAAAYGGATGDVSAVAADLAGRFTQVRYEQVEQQILSKRGLTFGGFYASHSSLNGQTVMLIDNQMAQFDLGVELLLAGVDEAGAHIHTVHNPGAPDRNHDPIAYAAIGSGAVHVLPSMAGFMHGPNTGYGRAVFHVYASKRRAEVAPGVGTATEMAIVGSSGVRRLERAQIDALENIYEAFIKQGDTELQKSIESLDLQEAEDGHNDESAH